MLLAKSLGRADSSLAGAEDCLGLLLFLFSSQPVQDGKTFTVGFVAAGNIGDTMSKDFVVEGVYSKAV